MPLLVTVRVVSLPAMSRSRKKKLNSISSSLRPSNVEFTKAVPRSSLGVSWAIFQSLLA